MANKKQLISSLPSDINLSESELEIGFFPLGEVEIPKFGTEGSACFDIAANLVYDPTSDLEKFIEGRNERNKPIRLYVSPNGELSIPGKTRAKIPTGLVFDIPQNKSVRLHPRSGCSWNKGLLLSNCEAVIDSDYVEEVFVLLTNTNESPVTIKHAERIAQGELVNNLQYKLKHLDKKPEKKTSRAGGFGSTGETVFLKEDLTE